jgi:ribonuclease HI
LGAGLFGEADSERNEGAQGAGVGNEEASGAESGSASPTRSGSGEWITAYCDGGSRGNPGPAGYGVYIEGPEGEKLAELSEYLGKTTNNVAEYSGLLAAVEFALKHGHRRLRVIADSELMVKQMKGQYKVNSPDLRPLYEEAKRRVASLEQFRVEHVLRGKNQRADRLANLAMDRGTGRGPAGPPGGAGAGAGPTRRPEPAAKPLKGYVKGGVVHLLEGELPDGVFVKVTVDRQ